MGANSTKLSNPIFFIVPPSEYNSSSAKVCWLVIGERCDAHMIRTETVWTDDDGKGITEVDQTPPLT